MTVPTVPSGAKQGADTREWSWVEASVWTERMVSALGNGVRGGKWYSLMDKVYAPKTLAVAWERVRANQGAAGVDGQSVERFAARAEDYLAELSRDLREGRYRPQPMGAFSVLSKVGSSRTSCGAWSVGRRRAARRKARSSARCWPMSTCIHWTKG
jgi:RNA-directed DNA polymerase